MFKLKTIVAAASLMALPAISQAAAPTLSDVLGASGITESGYLDASYNYLNSDGVFTIDSVPSRVFDAQPSAFTLNQVALTLAKQPAQGIGGLVNITTGKDADVISALGSASGDNFDVTQAFVQYATGGLTVIGGKFVTASGAEVINTPSNTNASRSILFGYAIPFTHTGVRATYKFSDQVSVFGGVNNGWDQLTDANKQKTAEVGVLLNPAKIVAVSLVGYSGVESGFNPGRRDLVDFVATITPTDALSLVLNYDYAKQQKALTGDKEAKWSGTAAYVNYKFCDQLRISVRGEYFDDKDGFRTGVVQKWKEATVTLGYSPTSSLDLLTEVRGDKSDRSSFVSGAVTKKSQTSAQIKAIYKF